jgi:hypothetical protein
MTTKEKAAAPPSANGGPQAIKHFNSATTPQTVLNDLLDWLHGNGLYSDSAMAAAMRDHKDWGPK